ncbi:YegJ family protein [Dokdonella ginsengisoli]|uniref:YegJ family protein n=1 Tax=Dokdonella ginsengisoli TaxID=363846 RepID=A0ABV9QNJ1_9GAMM
MRRSLCALALAAMLALPASGRAADRDEARDENEVVLVERGDADMTAAIAQARAKLDEFLVVAANPPAGTSDFKLKVAVRDGEDTEHFWVTPFRVAGKGFKGTLANEPQIVSNVEAGEEIEFSRADVSDWGYTKNGRQVGSYTVCVLFKQMPKEQAEYYRKNHGFDC